MPTQLPTGIQAGNPGALWGAPEVIELDHEEAYVIPAGVWWLYDTDADMDLEIVTGYTDDVADWTAIRDGTTVPGARIISDGVSLRLRNSHAETDDETATLIQIA